MTEDEAYKVHIQYTFNAFCKVVIRHAAIDKILKLRRRWEREVSLDYLMSEKFVQLAEPEQLEEYLFTACGQTAVLYHAELAAALALLPEQTQEEIFHRLEQTQSMSDMYFFTVISDSEKQRTAKEILCFIYLLNKKHLLSHLEGCTDIESNLQHWCNDIKNSCLM